ncbi:MAG: sugar-binding protein [Victivallaceae bacterium]|nr:sugar-binding protein [Victivallaceae bacterium]
MKIDRMQSKVKNMIFFSLILFALPCSLLAAEIKREYPCYRITQCPLLDGKIEEGVWDTIPEATGFFMLGGIKYAVQKQTFFKAAWSKDALYIAVKAEEPTPEKMLAKSKDGDRICWFEDGIEFFFFPEAAKTYFHLAANSIGSRWNDKTGEPIWNWQVKTYVGKDFWSLEAKIPFAVLGRTPEDGEKWLVNVGRTIRTGPDSELSTCWPPLKTSFHETANFGCFSFKNKSLSLQENARIEDRLNLPYYLFLRSEIDRMAKNYPKFKAAAANALPSQSLKKEAASLTESWKLFEKIASREKPSLQELRFFFRKNYDLAEKSGNFESRVSIEKLFD